MPEAGTPSIACGWPGSTGAIRCARRARPRWRWRPRAARAAAEADRRRCRDGRRRLRGRAGGAGRALAAACRWCSPRPTATSAWPTACSARSPKRVFLAFPIEGRDGDRYVVSGRPVPGGTGTADRLPRAGASASRRATPACWCSAARSAPAGSTTPPSTPSGARRRARCCTSAGSATTPTWCARLRALGAPAHYKLHAYVEPFADALAAADVVAPVRVARCSRSRRPGCRRSWCPTRTRRPTTRPPTPRYMEAPGGRRGRAGRRGRRSSPRPRGGRAAGSPERMRAMAEAAVALARPDAAERIAREILALAGVLSGGRARGQSGQGLGRLAPGCRQASVRAGMRSDRNLILVYLPIRSLPVTRITMRCPRGRSRSAFRIRRRLDVGMRPAARRIGHRRRGSARPRARCAGPSRRTPSPGSTAGACLPARTHNREGVELRGARPAGGAEAFGSDRRRIGPRDRRG